MDALDLAATLIKVGQGQPLARLVGVVLGVLVVGPIQDGNVVATFAEPVGEDKENKGTKR